MKKINLEILFLFGFLLFALNWTQGWFFNNRYGMLIIILFIIWLLVLWLYMEQSKKENKLLSNKKDYKEVAGNLVYLGGRSPAVLYIYKDKIVIKETLFRLVTLLLGKKDFTIPKDKIKEIKYLHRWPYFGINIITNEYASEELIFGMGVLGGSREKWQNILSEYGYKIE